MSLFTPAAEQAALRIGGREFAGWTEIGISASIEDAARAFTVKAAAKRPGDLHLLDIRPGSAVEVFAGSDRLISGYVDKLDVSFSSRGHTIAVSGRSKTGDLVDCSAIHESGQFRNKTADFIAKALAADYDVELVVSPDLDLSRKVRRFVVQDGETVIAAIQRLGQLRAFLVHDDDAGRLVLTRAGSADAATAIVVGQNVISGSASVDVSGRFTEYRCKSTRLGDDNDFGDVLQSEQAEEDSEDLGRRRVLEIRPESGEDAARCKERATWEAATRYGQSISLSYVVQGWRQSNGGPLWQPNAIAYVDDSLSGVSGLFLIVDVDFALGKQGTTTTLNLAPIEGFELLPPMQPRSGRRRRRRNNPFAALRDGVDITKPRPAMTDPAPQSTEVSP